MATNVDSNEFFVAGGTLRRDAASYVRRQADDELLHCLRKGQFCYILTSRQMGKSSLMVRTAAQLREEETAVALLDLTRVGQSMTAEQWYYGLLLDLGSQVGKRDQCKEFWQNNKELGPLQRYLECMREITGSLAPAPLVVFIDEIDVVRSLSFSTDEFFAGIRDCHNRRSEVRDLGRLTFCLLGVAAPSDLIRDTRLTPFNIGRRIELRDFTTTEAAPLAAGFAGKGSLTNRPRVLERILYWTGGHPYLTQRLCQVVAEAPSATPKIVDALCNDLYLSARARERDDNLLFVRERMLRSFEDLAALLEKYRAILDGERVADDEADQLVSLLRLAGIVRNDGGRLVVRNRIYAKVFDREWIRTSMPGAEVRRQKQAFRRGRTSTVLTLTAVFVIVQLGLLGYDIYRRKAASIYIAGDSSNPNVVNGMVVARSGGAVKVSGEEIANWRFEAINVMNPNTITLLSPVEGSATERGVELQMPVSIAIGSVVRIEGRPVAPFSFLSRYFVAPVTANQMISVVGQPPAVTPPNTQASSQVWRYYTFHAVPVKLQGKTLFAIHFVTDPSKRSGKPILLIGEKRLEADHIADSIAKSGQGDVNWLKSLYIDPVSNGVKVSGPGEISFVIDKERARLNGGTPQQVANRFVNQVRELVKSRQIK